MTVRCSGYVGETAESRVMLALASPVDANFTWIILPNGTVLDPPHSIDGVSVQPVSLRRDRNRVNVTSLLTMRMQSKFDGSQIACITDDIDENTGKNVGELRSKTHILPTFQPRTPKINHSQEEGAEMDMTTIECSAYVGSQGALSWLVTVGHRWSSLRITDNSPTPEATAIEPCLGACLSAAVKSRASYNRKTGAHINSSITIDLTEARNNSLLAIFTCMCYKLSNISHMDVHTRKIHRASVKFDYRSGALKVHYLTTPAPVLQDPGSANAVPVFVVFVAWLVIITGAWYYRTYVYGHPEEPETEHTETREEILYGRICGRGNTECHSILAQGGLEIDSQKMRQAALNVTGFL